ncbi:hypothetical protein GCM10009601_33950 [Streptomyces thermospinosisporus]|uniref:Peptidase M20 dimerisation domain-containing protein n=1 Tax=Streptomyces thermospinosisporus TaxID=161482 RepID=A0ABN1YZI9_9ACTN
MTSFHGGEGFSVVPDRCELNIDVRTTPGFDARDAETLVRKAVAELDAQLPAPRPTEVTPVAAWPLFRLAEGGGQPAAALLNAAAEAGLNVRAKTAGPSNIGNLLAGVGIPAAAGFGVPYEGPHAIDERARLAELPTVYAIYQRAVPDLLGGTSRARAGSLRDPIPQVPSLVTGSSGAPTQRQHHLASTDAKGGWSLTSAGLLDRSARPGRRHRLGEAVTAGPEILTRMPIPDRGTDATSSDCDGEHALCDQPL